MMNTPIPPEIIERHARQLFDSNCPVCGGRGPIDVHTSHQAISFFILTQWKSCPRLSCRPCGNKDRLNKTLLTAVAGWWGFPFGLILTPVQIIRNICGMLSTEQTEPSAKLREIAHSSLAYHVANQNKTNQQG